MTETKPSLFEAGKTSRADAVRFCKTVRLFFVCFLSKKRGKKKEERRRKRKEEERGKKKEEEERGKKKEERRKRKEERGKKKEERGIFVSEGNNRTLNSDDLSYFVYFPHQERKDSKYPPVVAFAFCYDSS
jgi:hypothetical protein